jgi:RNA polymerase sigma-70 factor (ECF subfamily)
MSHPMGEPRFDETLELLRNARAGDRAALEALLERSYPQVLAIVRRRLGGALRRHHESVDVVQEAMVEALRGFDRFELRDDRAFLAWLAAIVENRVRDLAKYHGRDKRDQAREARESSLDPEGAGLEPLAVTDVTPSAVAGRGEETSRVQSALAALPERQRRAIELRLADRSWAQVAQELEFPTEGAARMFHSRAMVALARAAGAPPPASGAEP